MCNVVERLGACLVLPTAKVQDLGSSTILSGQCFTVGGCIAHDCAIIARAMQYVTNAVNPAT